jgi:ATP:ADP antiporter, AAA family
MGKRIVQALWGNLKGEELKKFALLSTGFFFLIGSFWPLKTIKDSIFLATTGSIYQPYAKMASIVMFFPLVLIYSKLIDHFSKEKMIYLLISFYSILGLVFVYLMKHPSIGLANTIQTPYRFIGWGFYLFVETYISLIVSLYWAFINDITKPESAKRGYGMLIFGTQLGGAIFTIVGRYLSRDPAKFTTVVPMIALISICFFLAIALIVFILTHTVSKKELSGYQEEEQKIIAQKTDVGFWEGLKLLIKCRYVGGIFGLVLFQEITTTIMNYQMYISVEKTFMKNAGLINKYLFTYALMCQVLACLFGLFGTSFFQRKFGIRACLIAFPILLGAAILGFAFFPTLYVVTGVMIIAKGLNYSLNQPAKEALYIPTSKAVKYKSKAWIDMFGLRASKGVGSVINKIFGVFSGATAVISIGLIFLWTALASATGKRYKKVVHDKKIIR